MEGLLALAADLQRRGTAFALATVVRCEAPTSAKPGAKALVREDGSIEGWVGGACAEPVVVREALNALRDGQPRLIGLYGQGTPGAARTEGILDHAMTCHSGGTLEIYVEPYLPVPLLVLMGHGPVVDTLAALGRATGYSVVLLPDAASWAGVGALGLGRRAAGVGALGLGRRASVVVATHADSDEDALEQVLRTEAGYVSLVASRRRATAVVERLRQRGVPSERLGRFKAPAGLDLGAVTPAEIAVSILAEMIQHHRGDKLVESPAPTAAAASDATDPICGMLVEIATARFRSEAGGRSTYFCCRNCQTTFEQDPARYLAQR